MMNNSNGGYDYSTYGNSSTNNYGTSTQQQQQQQQQQQPQHHQHHHHHHEALPPRRTAAYLPSELLAGSTAVGGVGPGASLYDPTASNSSTTTATTAGGGGLHHDAASSSAAAQHDLVMAYLAANYAPDTRDQQVLQYQQHLHNTNNNHPQSIHHHLHNPAGSSASSSASSSNAALAALLGNPFASLHSVQNQQQPHHQLRAANLSPISFLRQQQQQQQQTRLLSRPDSFDDLMFLQQSAQNPSIAASSDFSYYPLSISQQQQLLQQQLPQLLSSPSVSSTLPKLPQYNEPWLEEVQLTVSSLSMEPMSGSSVVERLREKMNDVLTKYIPCVDFLVQCQQDLRKGLEFASAQKRFGSRGNRGMTASQFFKNYVEPLVQSFYVKQQNQMEINALQEAYLALDKLQHEAKNVERQGCEAIKSTFLGGMKDGESWGLRKWLSKHGSALPICTDLECILNSCQKLDRSADSTSRLAKLLRPMAQHVLDKLHSDIPASYQQHSTAHPYLPFFHRLESALRGMSTFDPEDDDVICLDDSDDEGKDVKVEVVPSSLEKSSRAKKRGATAKSQVEDAKRRAYVDPPTKFANNVNGTHDASLMRSDDSSSSGESECLGVVEIVDAKPFGGSEDWVCPSCMTHNAVGNMSCRQCGELSLSKDLGALLGLDDFLDRRGTPGSFDSGPMLPQYENNCGSDFVNDSSGSQDVVRKLVSPQWPVPLDQPDLYSDKASLIANNLDELATLFDQNEQDRIRLIQVHEASFWDAEHYAGALRLFAFILRMPEAPHFLELVDDDAVAEMHYPAYSRVIKHPISLRQIAQALLGDDLMLRTGMDGSISIPGLVSWNMWNGRDLLQAIDLVFLNTLAYGNAIKQGKSLHRSTTNKIRKAFWTGIANIVGRVDADVRKRFYPVRRSEKSGFIVFKGDDN